MPLLIVEDDRANREALARLLHHEGRIVHVAASIGEAMQKLELSPRAVLLDVHLPDGNGLSVLHYIRANGLEAKVAVLTGSIEERAVTAASVAQPDAIFIKPFPVRQLLDWVEKVAPLPGRHAGVATTIN